MRIDSKLTPSFGSVGYWVKEQVSLGPARIFWGYIRKNPIYIKTKIKNLLTILEYI